MIKAIKPRSSKYRLNAILIRLKDVNGLTQIQLGIMEKLLKHLVRQAKNEENEKR